MEDIKDWMINPEAKYKSMDLVEFKCKCGNIGKKKLTEAKRTLSNKGFAYQCSSCLKDKISKGNEIIYTSDFLESSGVVDVSERRIKAHEIVSFKCRCGMHGDRKWTDAQKTFKLYGFYHQCDACRQKNMDNRANNQTWKANVKLAAQSDDHKARAIQKGKDLIKYMPDQIERVILASGATYEGDLSSPSNTIKIIWSDGISRTIRIRRFMLEGKIERPKTGENSFSHQKHLSEVESLGLLVEIIGEKTAKITYKGIRWEQYWVNHVDKKCRRKMKNIDNGLRIQELLASGVTLSRACKEVGVDHNRYYRNMRDGITPMETAVATKHFERLIHIDGAIYDRKLAGTDYRPDILIEEHKLIIETDGMVWHSEKFKEKKYHATRWNCLHNLGYKILGFSEYEVKEKREIVNSMINHRLKKSVVVNASDCELKDITAAESNAFFERCHLKGRGAGPTLALFYQGVIMSALRFVEIDGIINISRFACELGHTVSGGYSKLLSKLPNDKDIINFVDRRHGSGEHLLSLGFIKKNIHIGFEWTDDYRHWNRRTHLGNSGYDKGLCKFWDYGQIKYVRVGIKKK